MFDVFDIRRKMRRAFFFVFGLFRRSGGDHSGLAHQTLAVGDLIFRVGVFPDAADSDQTHISRKHIHKLRHERKMGLFNDPSFLCAEAQTAEAIPVAADAPRLFKDGSALCDQAGGNGEKGDRYENDAAQKTDDDVDHPLYEKTCAVQNRSD